MNWRLLCPVWGFTLPHRRSVICAALACDVWYRTCMAFAWLLSIVEYGTKKLRRGVA
jgi:hypothetical protein